jgi:hypothetical protein
MPRRQERKQAGRRARRFHDPCHTGRRADDPQHQREPEEQGDRQASSANARQGIVTVVHCVHEDQPEQDAEEEEHERAKPRVTHPAIEHQTDPDHRAGWYIARRRSEQAEHDDTLRNVEWACITEAFGNSALRTGST